MRIKSKIDDVREHVSVMRKTQKLHPRLETILEGILDVLDDLAEKFDAHVNASEPEVLDVDGKPWIKESESNQRCPAMTLWGTRCCRPAGHGDSHVAGIDS